MCQNSLWLNGGDRCDVVLGGPVALTAYRSIGSIDSYRQSTSTQQQSTLRTILSRNTMLASVVNERKLPPARHVVESQIGSGIPELAERYAAATSRRVRNPATPSG